MLVELSTLKRQKTQRAAALDRGLQPALAHICTKTLAYFCACWLARVEAA
jgi:hypothetical protein